MKVAYVKKEIFATTTDHVVTMANVYLQCLETQDANASWAIPDHIAMSKVTLKLILIKNIINYIFSSTIIKKDPCNPNPCISGTCSNEGGNFLCHCPSGYSGTRCENRDHCNPNPCNLGKCTSQGNHYVCQCPPGYSGQHCENRDVCHPNPCHNGLCLPANNQSN